MQKKFSGVMVLIICTPSNNCSKFQKIFLTDKEHTQILTVKKQTQFSY